MMSLLATTPIRRAPTRQIALTLPVALTGRLDALMRASDEAGLPTSRRELLAAIVHGASPAPRKLSSAIRTLRRAQIEDAFVDGQPHEAILAPLRAPGPRQRRLWEDEPQLFDPDEEPSWGPKPPHPGDRLLYGPRRRVGIELPLPVNARLNDLVDVAEGAGERTSRQELIAALILTALATPNALLRLLRNYRTAAIRDTIIPNHDPAPYLEQVAPRRGRPVRQQRRDPPRDPLLT